MHGLGLVTLALGLHLTLETHNILIVMFSVLAGGVLGEWWRIEAKLNALGEHLRQSTQAARGQEDSPSKDASDFVTGFVTASLVFCVGPMTILGSIQSGLTGDHSLLAIKSLLDGFAALAFASSLGVGVLFSSLTVLVYQGTITLLAGAAQSVLTDPMTTEMTATGGILIMGIGLSLLELKRIRVGNFLPALAIAPLIVAGLSHFGVQLP
jgi:uncharacterized membrane protein YqgA involved in biofilm formation